ncbi:MAG TPA: hypothetical protein VKJ47_17100 [Candidatus Binatia bacterium]|nr:hypothetical protein [Candidatus Binatia bacterium]
MSTVGATLKRHDNTDLEAGNITIDGSIPTAADPGESKVELSYQVDDRQPVPCTVQVRFEGGSWLFHSPSDVECWPKPRKTR